MPDISMCAGVREKDGISIRCRLRESCLRFKSKPDDFQSYLMEPPFESRQLGGSFEHTCEFRITIFTQNNGV